MAFDLMFWRIIQIVISVWEVVITIISCVINNHCHGIDMQTALWLEVRAFSSAASYYHSDLLKFKKKKNFPKEIYDKAMRLLLWEEYPI